MGQKVLALVAGKIVEIDMDAFKLVTLVETSGSPRVVNAAFVEQLEYVSAVKTKIHLSNSANFSAQGGVEVIKALLEA